MGAAGGGSYGGGSGGTAIWDPSNPPTFGLQLAVAPDKVNLHPPGYKGKVQLVMQRRGGRGGLGMGGGGYGSAQQLAASMSAGGGAGHHRYHHHQHGPSLEESLADDWTDLAFGVEYVIAGRALPATGACTINRPLITMHD